MTVLSEAAGCQKSYFSSCLKDKCHLTLDHVYGISEYLQLNEAEENYFFLLLEKDKCSTLKLRKKLEVRLRDMAREAHRIKNQVGDSLIVKEDQASAIGIYYSNWIFMAIHSLTSVDRYQTVDRIAERMNMAKPLVQMYLNQLEKLELIKKDGQRYKWNTFNLILDDDSVWIGTHHSNWRVNALTNIQKKDPSAYRYSVVQSMSESDFELLKKKIAQFIKEFNKVSDPSEPEESYNFNIDFYKV